MKRPDITKKRFRYNNYFMKVVTPELYDKWKKENLELSHKINSFGSFKKYWRKISDEIISEVCINPFGVLLPYYCGELSIKFSNIDLKPVNIRASGINEKIIPHLNWNSSERVGKLVWNTHKAAKFNSMIRYYGFKGVRLFNQKVNKALLENPEVFKVYSNDTINEKILERAEQRSNKQN